MTTPWTRIEHSTLWNEAREAYRRNGLPYHGFGHIEALYGWADRLGVPYSHRLDENILTHDVEMLLGPELNERGSAQWLVARGRTQEWAAPILDTIHHAPSEDRTGLAMLDLMDFADPFASRRNTELLRQEAMKIAGEAFEQKVWLRGTMSYLSGLSERIRHDLPGLDGLRLKCWTRIARGIAVTMSCAPHTYDPHPSSGIRRFTPDAEAMAFVLGAQEGPQCVGSLSGIAKPWMPEGTYASNALTQLMIEGIAARRADPALGPVWELTAEGRSWLDRMNAPEQDYPEPVFP